MSELRIEKGLSQRKLAQRIGLNSSMITLYENGDRFPSLSTLLKLAHVFGVTTDYLLGDSEHRACYLDVEGLNQEQIASIESIIESYRKLMGADTKKPYDEDAVKGGKD